MFARRLGPAADATRCAGGYSCPEVWELEDGDFAVIGADITAQASQRLPQGSGCGAGERIVRVPRRVLVEARANIPSAP